MGIGLDLLYNIYQYFIVNMLQSFTVNLQYLTGDPSVV